MCTTEKLLERIEFLRNKMTDVALEKGFTSIESITISQELDRLLNLFDDVKQTKHQKSID
ncbi:aspartyl-phosphate phosphatase Spo0E family protein [Virgibacillus litoralis]|nr:aspartyl-phosphate phosphatase Spo0E family protein [Virgibacillus litoralis]